jgi:hypothetical protein
MFIKEWHRFAVEEADTQSVQGYTRYAQAPDTVVPAKITPKNPERNAVGRAAWEIITEVGRPIPRAELFARLAGKGMHIHGKDPEMVLSTMMWRMQEHFVRLPKHGYWKRTVPWPPADYVPGASVEDDGEDQKILQNSLFDPASVADA